MKKLLFPLVCIFALLSFSAFHPARIVNGLVIDISQAPYQVLIDGGSDGGGSIIAPQWILTAAHLTSITSGKAGVSTRSQAGQSLQIAGVFRPNNFNEQSTGQSISYISNVNQENDIALIKLSQPINLTTAQSIQLASTQNASLWNTGQTAFVSGFGRTSISDPLSQQLRRVNTNIISGGGSVRKIYAQGPGNNDACQGDSGGPLVSSNVLIGIVSSDLAGSSGQPSCGGGGKYTRVANYLEYIIRTIHLQGTPDLVCANTTFTNIDKMPDGCSFSWTATPASLFSQTSGTGLTFTTSQNGTNSGYGNIRLDVTTPAGTFYENKQVWVGRPGNISITTDGTFTISPSYTTSICRTFGYCMTSQSEKATSFSYSGWPTYNSFFNTSTVSVSNDRACFGTYNTGSYFLNIYSSNACSSNNRILVITVNNCGYRAFPNPAQSKLTIQFENPELTESIPERIELKSEKTQKTVRSLDWTQKKKTSNPETLATATLLVDDLPRGTYYLNLSYNSQRVQPTETVRIILN